MKRIAFLVILLLTGSFGTVRAQEEGRYIEVTGSAEMEIVPDIIHYVIYIKEYWKEEFDGKSKPEDYRTKVPLSEIEKEVRKALGKVGIDSQSIRTQEMGHYWRQTGKDFLLGKQFDLTLSSFLQVDALLEALNMRGIESMYIGELKSKNAELHRKQGKIAALKAARDKAEYLVRSVGKNLGDVIRITERDTEGRSPYFYTARGQSNISAELTGGQEYRILKQRYEIIARFAIKD